jgi:toluene monooxygenase system ferredoxin subunit
MIAKETLARLELFEGLPDLALQAIAALSQERAFAARATIFSPEQPSNQICILLDGSIRLTVFASPLSEPVTVSVLNTPGQTFGFSSVIGPGHHSSSAEAVTNARIIEIKGKPLLDYLAKEPAVGFVVMRRVANVVSRRLAAMRKLLLETIIDYERPASATPEN